MNESWLLAVRAADRNNKYEMNDAKYLSQNPRNNHNARLYCKNVALQKYHTCKTIQQKWEWLAGWTGLYVKEKLGTSLS